MFRYLTVRSTLLPIGAFSTAFSASRRGSPTHCSSNDKKGRQLLSDRVVIITGATAGIGEACAKKFADEGSKLVLIGRREQKLQALKTLLLQQYPNLSIHTIAMSVCDLEKVADLPAILPSEFADVDVLINNAGLALGVAPVDQNSIADAATVIETNVIGTIAMCSAFLPGMKARGRGHIINMGSVAGHYAYQTGSVYNASKYAVRGFTEAARHDLIGTPIRITHLSPGLVSGTEFSNVRLKDDQAASQVYANVEALRPEDVANAAVFAASQPSHVQIADIIMYCTNQSGPRDVARLGPTMGAPAHTATPTTPAFDTTAQNYA